MSKEKSDYFGGIFISSLIGITLIILKLCRVITLAWVWVLAPYWIWSLSLCLSVSILYIVDTLSKKVSDTEEIENNGL